MSWLERVKQMLTAQRSTGETRTPMQAEIERWNRMYRQGRAAGRGKLALPAAVAGELARLAVCELDSGITGGARGRYLDRQYRRALSKLRVWAEYGFAGGGMVLKVCPSGSELVVECIESDRFRPLEWDADGEITDAEFEEQRSWKGGSYRRIERHRLTAEGYEITNRALDAAGNLVPLCELPCWEDLPAAATLKGITRPLFVYYRTPMPNRIDSVSPLGASVFAGACELIEQAEEQWERINWEYKGGELAIDASEDLFEHRRDGSVVLPQGQERLFRAHDIDIGESAGHFLEVFSPELRDQSLFNGLNNILRRIEFNCGLAYGTLSEVSEVERTAQEVKAGRQRSYATVCELQISLEKALRELVCVMDIWATLGGLCPQGDWKLRLCWGDSIITDSETLRQNHRLDVAAGLMTAEEYRDYWYDKGKEVKRNGTRFFD